MICVQRRYKQEIPVGKGHCRLGGERCSGQGEGPTEEGARDQDLEEGLRPLEGERRGRVGVVHVRHCDHFPSSLC